MKDKLILPRTTDSVPTPRSKDRPGIAVPKGAPKIMESNRFKMLVKKFEDTGKLDREDFSSGADLGAFIDFYNNTVLKARQSKYENDVTEMNKYYRKLWIRYITGDDTFDKIL